MCTLSIDVEISIHVSAGFNLDKRLDIYLNQKNEIDGFTYNSKTIKIVNDFLEGRSGKSERVFETY